MSAQVMRLRLLRRALPVVSLAVLGVLSFTPAALASTAAPSLSFTPSSWTAGPIDSGTTTTQTFTLTNTGGKASGGLTVTLPGSAAFTTTADTCTGRSLGPGKSCSITVQYAPASNAENDTATLTATGAQASATAPLSGSSTNPNPFAQSQADCEAIGGTFSTDPSTDVLLGGAGFIWSCNNSPVEPGSRTLIDDCLNDGGGTLAAGSSDLSSWYGTCAK